MKEELNKVRDKLSDANKKYWVNCHNIIHSKNASDDEDKITIFDNRQA